MNWIQQHVLLELIRHTECRYSELRPDGVEGNLFLYHLDGLIKDGLVEKIDRHYRLSTKGLQHAGHLSLATGKQRQQPKILNAIICQNQSGEHLLSRWNRQPNTGLVSFPHGMMHYGAIHLNMAAAELAEKAGLRADLAHRGEVYVRGLRGDEIDRHMLVHLFEATNPEAIPDPPLRPEVSESFWTKLDHIPQDDFVPGFYEIAHLAQAPGPIFADITVDVPSDRS